LNVGGAAGHVRGTRPSRVTYGAGPRLGAASGTPEWPVMSGRRPVLVQFVPAIATFEPWENDLPLTQTQLVSAIADRAELSKADAKRALSALEDVVLEEVSNAQKVRIGGLVQLTVRVKPAQKKRPGRNPATGEEITIAAKPASVDIRARPLAKAKGALPSVQKARRRLAA
jgi:DNA-binding protein HU-beta